MTLQSTNTQPVNEYEIPPDYSNFDPETLTYVPYGNPSGENVTSGATTPVKTMDWVTAGGPVEPDAPKGPQVEADKPPVNPYNEVALYDSPQEGGPFEQDLAPPPDKAAWIGLDCVDATKPGGKKEPCDKLPEYKNGEKLPEYKNGEKLPEYKSGDKLPEYKLVVSDESNWSGDKAVTDALAGVNALLFGSEGISPGIGIDAKIIENVLGKGDANGLPGVALGKSQFEFVKTDGAKTLNAGGGDTSASGATASAGAGGSTLEKAPTALANNDTFHFSHTSLDSFMKQFGLDKIDPHLAELLGEQDFGSQGPSVQMIPDLFSIAPPAVCEAALIMQYELTAA